MLQSRFLRTSMTASRFADNEEDVIQDNQERNPKWIQIESEVLGKEHVLVVFDKSDLSAARKEFPNIPIYFPPEIECLWETKHLYKSLNINESDKCDDRLSPPHSPCGGAIAQVGGEGGKNEALNPSGNLPEGFTCKFMNLLKMINFTKKYFGGWVVPK